MANRTNWIAENFAAPVGSETAKGFYIAQGFGEPNPRFRNSRHLGEDWNYNAGGDSDFAAPVYSIGRGIITYRGDIGGGWGKVVRICHKLGDNLRMKFNTQYLESIYAHLYDFEVDVGQEIQEGQWIGSMGDANGSYLSHLHFEIRTDPNEELGGGYDKEIPNYYLNPVDFLRNFQKSIALPQTTSIQN
ncbi:M23 family metallopeptidase [Leptospira sp. GIMC2001]|uniref:M23 family metallopeptidase n=1 Tax=Leptospira sp. GIMC2001 TaxID=1513297 RepID=UPI00234A731B|nr:M23 family metallopeptidase [Leptospira sp. GIMC2001]WCL49897.1 M23 family metallopeptidase [Leptospira sp. GIMC2001]